MIWPCAQAGAQREGGGAEHKGDDSEITSVHTSLLAFSGFSTQPMHLAHAYQHVQLAPKHASCLQQTCSLNHCSHPKP